MWEASTGEGCVCVFMCVRVHICMHAHVHVCTEEGRSVRATRWKKRKRHTVGFSPVKQEALDLSSVNNVSISSNVFGRS